MAHALHKPWVSWEVANDMRPQAHHSHYQPWLIAGGWAALRKQIDAAYKLGFRVVFIHRPFGEANGGGNMAADSRAVLYGDRVAGKLVKGYDAFQRALLKAYPDLHLVCYLGTLRTPALEALRKSAFSAWLDRLRRAYLPLLDAERVHVGLDFASSYPLDSEWWSWCQVLQAHKRRMGCECVIESLPPEERGLIGLVTEESWQANQTKMRVPERGLVRWFKRSTYYNHKLRARPFLADCKSLRHTPCIDWTLIEPEGLTYQEVAA